jgi:ABC-type bacteriocin/lantibiotic exporter with double-glycine peptidase domain
MDNYYGISLNYTKISSLNSSLSSLILGVPVVLLITFGGYMVMDGSISLGTFTAFLSYTTIFFSPISQLSSIWTSYKSSLPAFDRLKAIYDMEPEVGVDNEITVNEGIITFENVWFSYDNRDILKGFNATFKPGLNYIVGDNGTGKSTILKLICALYPVDKGCIKVDGQNIDEIKRDGLISNISMIFSDPYLFDGTIYENLRIGNFNATEEDIIRVSKLVKIHEFIESTPDKYKTQVGEDGLMLSSGEKQKIALARAVLKNSPIILLDEVTKSIDKDSREAINNAIKNLMVDKTVIIVTHNSSEIEDNSNISYIEQENGSDGSNNPLIPDTPEVLP